MAESPAQGNETEGGEAWAPTPYLLDQGYAFTLWRPFLMIPRIVISSPDSLSTTAKLNDDP
jgi:hypothetical protein